jgi:hypothetical protein
MTILAWTTAAGANQHQASPSLCNQWAGSEGENAAAARGKENVELLGEMFNAYFDENKKTPKTARMNLTAACAAGLGALANTINNQNVAGGANPTFQNLGDNPSEYTKARFRKAVKMMYGFAANMPEWAYPACRHYYTALKSEADGGFSADFTKKHMASTENEKSSLQVARIRATPVAQRNVFAYGNILTAHSGAIKKGEAEATFKNEVKSRQLEFTDTHILLCKYFSENFLNFSMPPAGQFLFIDGVTFVSHAALDMFEFTTPVAGATPERNEGKYYVHFSISATADGSGWAVHHLARATENPQDLAAGRTRLAEIIGNTQGFTALDPRTYMNDIAFG